MLFIELLQLEAHVYITHTSNNTFIINIYKVQAQSSTRKPLKFQKYFDKFCNND